MTYQYLHRVNDLGWRLDHRVTPEVSALFCAMASRLPAGGIAARYEQVVDKIAEGLFVEVQASHLEAKSDFIQAPWETAKGNVYPWGNTTYGAFFFRMAENKLTEYPLHPVVQEFFDRNVRKYGHGSIKELTSQPAVFFEGVSPYTAYLTFDNPLVAGQEASTRAVRHMDWPMCVEATNADGKPSPVLRSLHLQWLALFEYQVDLWRAELRSQCPICMGTKSVVNDFDPDSKVAECVRCEGTGRKYPWIDDPQAFRPALDRARFAIPGTIATACSHTASLRTMARVLQDGAAVSAGSVAQGVWKQMAEIYDAALPGMKGMGLNEAVFTTERSLIPGHLAQGSSEDWSEQRLNAPGMDGPLDSLPDDWDVELGIVVDDNALQHLNEANPFECQGPKSYIDPVFNQLIQVRVHIQCSWAVARDWHRHRTLYPWALRLVRNPDGPIRLHPDYRVLEDEAIVSRLLQASTDAYDAFSAAGDPYRAMLCLPLGTQVEIRGSGGLRDVLYALKLRAHAHGANFEYERQAKALLVLLRQELEDLKDAELMTMLGEIL